MRLFYLFASAFGLAIAALQTGLEAGVVITSNKVSAHADVGSASDTDEYIGTDLILNQTLLAQTGSSSSQVVIDYSLTNGQHVFSHDIDQSRLGSNDDFVRSSPNDMYFTLDSAMEYDISGFLKAIDINENKPGRLAGQVLLRDITNGVYLVNHWHESRATANESFTFGGGANQGDTNSHEQGSLTGTLAAGEYRFYWVSWSQAWPETDDGATVTGNVTLTLGTTASVPEPCSLAVFGVFATGGVLGARRRRNA